MGVKQKSQASAAFLGVLIVSENVVSRCCILTTIFDDPRVGKATSGTLRPEAKSGERQRIKRPAIAGLRAATKKAAAVDAAAFREIVDRWRAR
jgi:hypothetical protein